MSKKKSDPYGETHEFALLGWLEKILSPVNLKSLMESYSDLTDKKCVGKSFADGLILQTALQKLSPDHFSTDLSSKKIKVHPLLSQAVETFAHFCLTNHLVFSMHH
jgi:hypothetical protein